MQVPRKPQLTRLINLMGSGDEPARYEVLDTLYDSMLEVARRVRWRSGQRGQTQTHELVHDGLLKIAGRPGPWTDTRHFLATLALAIQSARVDALRARRRDEGSLSDHPDDGAGLVAVEDGPVLELLALDEALSDLAEESPLAGEVVRMRYFAQATHSEIATDLGIPLIRARRLWQMATRWLRARLDDETD